MALLEAFFAPSRTGGLFPRINAPIITAGIRFKRIPAVVVDFCQFCIILTAAEKIKFTRKKA